MRRTLILLPGLAFLAVACDHSAGYNNAMAECESSAIQAMEAADPDPDQRATWREEHIRQCMAGKGFTE
jgi:hypothetical protein